MQIIVDSFVGGGSSLTTSAVELLEDALGCAESINQLNARVCSKGVVNRLVNRVVCMLAEASVIPYKAMRYAVSWMRSPTHARYIF
jgi:hypothetical protein